MDQHLLWSILTNLISNALKYSRQGDIINVTTTIKDNLLTIVVKDNGIGIPAKEHKYVFERFYRAPNALNYEGTGLGLHIVRKNVKLLKGTVSFISEVNKGTEFTVTLPLLEEVKSSRKSNFKVYESKNISN
jgi:signal transduction histidine kinase